MSSPSGADKTTVRLACIDAPETSQALVETGVDFVYWQYIDGCDRETYALLENEARFKSLGVWHVPGGNQRPWDYIRGREACEGLR